MPIIEVTKLTKTFKVKKRASFWRDLFAPSFQTVTAVDRISFSIQKGEAVAFLGPNGAGKTTTIKMLSGLMYPSAGAVSVLGHTPFNWEKDFLQKIGLVMGNKAGLNWDLTPSQSFELLKKIYHIERPHYESRLKDLMDLLDVSALLHTRVRKLSLGERMKMELIGAILHNPEVLFLDEPTIGLDIISKQKIRAFLKNIQQKFHTTLLLTSHDMDDIERVCDRVIVINHGHLVADEPLGDLTAKYRQQRYVKFVFETVPALALQKFPSTRIIETDATSILIAVSQTELPALLAYIAGTYTPHDIEILSVPLEEIIADLFRSSQPDPHLRYDK